MNITIKQEPVNLESFIVVMYKHDVRSYDHGYRHIVYTEHSKKRLGIHGLEIQQNGRQFVITLELAMPYERSI